MPTRSAIGISVNGTKVKAAYISLIKGNVYIKALESASLKTPIEQARSSQDDPDQAGNIMEKAFNIREPITQKSSPENPAVETLEPDNNVSVLYALLDKFQQDRANVGINTPVLTVKYDLLDADVVSKDRNFKKRIKARLDIWGNNGDGARRANYIRQNRERILKVDYDYHPPLIDLLDEVNQFRAGSLNLVHMDTNELALVDLIKELYKFEKDEISAIIYIEQDFSRVIFLKGLAIYHITPIIHKGTTSTDVLEVIYRKIIYAQDHYFIPELNNIILASYSYRMRANKFFKQKFPYATTGYVNDKKLIPDPQFQKGGRLFSQYAIPISLAWKALQNKSAYSKSPNFLPEYILERQKMPKLALHGYLLLFVIALTTFIFTGLLIVKNVQIKRLEQKNNTVKMQIESNRPLADRVKKFDNQIIEFENNTSLVDSFSAGYKQTIEFLNALAAGLDDAGRIWITELSKEGDKAGIRGIALQRERIPVLSNSLGGASLKMVTRSMLYDENVFTFNIEKTITDSDDTTDRKIRSARRDRPEKSSASGIALKNQNGDQRLE